MQWCGEKSNLSVNPALTPLQLSLSSLTHTAGKKKKQMMQSNPANDHRGAHSGGAGVEQVTLKLAQIK